jgi:membrane protein
MVYRLAPDREAPRLRWVSIGAVVATVVWIVASIGLSLYVGNFRRLGKPSHRRDRVMPTT